MSEPGAAPQGDDTVRGFEKEREIEGRTGKNEAGAVFDPIFQPSPWVKAEG